MPIKKQEKSTMQRFFARTLLSLLVLAVFFGCAPGADWNPGEPGVPGQAPLFQFVQLSDLHLGKNSPQPEDNLRHAVSQIGELKVDFVLLSGDLTDHGRSGEYETLKSILADLPVPWHCVPGDNDILDGEGDLQRYRHELGMDYGSFEFQGHRFIGLNNVLDPSLDQEQRQWLENELAGNPATVVFAHKALLDASRDFEPYPNCLPLLSLLENHGASFYLNGDVHQSSTTTRNGIHHVQCDNLNYFHRGLETYNLYRVYADAIDLHHVSSDGSTPLAARLLFGPQVGRPDERAN